MSAFGNSPLVLGGNSLSVASGTSPVGTLGITDDQVAVGAATPNTIEGSANFTFGLAEGLRLSNSVTGGAQLYNTADQTTNYERFEALWSSNILTLGNRTANSGTGRKLNLFSQSSSGGAVFSRVDLSATVPFFKQGLFVSATSSTVASTSQTGAFIQTNDVTSTATSGSVAQIAITPTYNQASGTAANTDLLVNRTETAIGSGAQMLADFQIGSTSIVGISRAGVSLRANTNSSQGGALTSVRKVRSTTAIADNTGTATFTVTVPNAAHSATIRATFVGSLGAGGAVGANEATGAISYDFSVARTAGVDTVVTASSAYGSATSAVTGAATITITAAASTLTGASSATQTFTLNVTIARGSGSSTNHTCLSVAELLNANATGVLIA